MTAVLTSLLLSHFRSHRTTRLEFDGRPVAIWGANGAGKTNLIEAISFLSPGQGLRRASTDDLVRKPENLGWNLRADLAGQEVRVFAEPGQARQVRINEKASPQNGLARLARVLWLVPSMDRLWIEAAEGRRRFLDRITLSFFPDHAEASLDYGRAMRERNRLLKDMVRDAHWYAAVERQMARAGVVIAANRQAAIDRLMAAQDAEDESFPAADLSLSHPDAPLPEEEDDLHAAFVQGRPRDLAAGRTLVGPHRMDMEAVWRRKGIAARECSTGEQKALLISLILANARAVQGLDGSTPILLLDEVAAHLDAGRRARLYDAICALPCQAFLTGTGPELFAELGDRAMGLIVSEENGTSKVEERPIE